jgi:hypothetical protein
VVMMPRACASEIASSLARCAATGMAALDAVLTACRAGTAAPVVAVSTTD